MVNIMWAKVGWALVVIFVVLLVVVVVASKIAESREKK